MTSPDGPSVSASDARLDARRAQIRDALLPEIERQLREGATYADISVQSLVSSAGVSRSTFYSYFADKTDLLRSFAEQVFAQTTESAAAWLELGGEITYADLHESLARAIRIYLVRAPLMAAVYDGARYDDSLRFEIERITEGLVAQVTAHIERGQAGGWVDPTLLPRETAAWVTCMFERTQHQAMAGKDEAEVERLIRGGTAVLWRGLYEPTSAARTH